MSTSPSRCRRARAGASSSCSAMSAGAIAGRRRSSGIESTSRPISAASKAASRRRIRPTRSPGCTAARSGCSTPSSCRVWRRRCGPFSASARRTGGSGAGCTRRRCIAPTGPSRSDANSPSNPMSRRTGSPSSSSESRSGPAATAPPLPLEDGKTLHLHATDPGLGDAGEWTINVSDNGIAWSHEHGKGSVALRGGATELLLAMARRTSLAETGIEIFGDDSVWQNWLERTPL